MHRVYHCCHSWIVHRPMSSTLSPLTDLNVSENGSMLGAYLDHEIVESMSIHNDEWPTVEDANSFIMDGAR